MLPLLFSFLGSSLSQYAWFGGIVLAFVLAGQLLYYLSKTVFHRLASKSETKLDDVFLSVLQGPLVGLLMVGGLYFGFSFLTPDLPGLSEAYYRLLSVLVILLMAWLVWRLIDSLMIHYLIPFAEKTDSKLDDQLIPILRKVSKLALVLITLVVVLDGFGYNVTALIAGLGIGGLAIAFAAQKTMANVFGGATILVDHPFVVEDHIKVGDVEGRVEKIGLRTTRIRSLDNHKITFPNSNLADSVITNITGSQNRRVEVVLSLVYGTPVEKLRRAAELARMAVASVPGTVPPQTAVGFYSFADSSLDLHLRYFLSDPETFFEVRSEVNFKIKELFEKEGLEFAYPTRTLYLNK
ncbi:MAG: mechanosensitive ion channel family protein [Candidatus Diapherotrites archaeon]|nr:mechanosensitive ion channel family protein [Candidatus Diapherotrites archaeon]